MAVVWEAIAGKVTGSPVAAMIVRVTAVGTAGVVVCALAVGARPRSSASRPNQTRSLPIFGLFS